MQQLTDSLHLAVCDLGRWMSGWGWYVNNMYVYIMCVCVCVCVRVCVYEYCVCVYILSKGNPAVKEQ